MSDNYGGRIRTFSSNPSTSSSRSRHLSVDPLASTSSCSTFAANLEYEVSFASRRDSRVRHCRLKLSYVDILEEFSFVGVVAGMRVFDAAEVSRPHVHADC